MAVESGSRLGDFLPKVVGPGILVFLLEEEDGLFAFEMVPLMPLFRKVCGVPHFSLETQGGADLLVLEGQ
jgi:hypothetical protein